MPELAEVEIVRRNLAAWWTTPVSEVRLLDDAVLTRGGPQLLRELMASAAPTMARRGKYLIAHFPGDRAIIFHFRMTGKIVRAFEPHPRFARLAWNGAAGEWLVFKDARRLGHVDLFDAGELASYQPLQRIGPEPHGLTGEALAERLSPRRRLKAALLDQSVIAGVGNIAISEVFWRLRFAPDIKVEDLSAEQVASLAAELPRYFDELLEEQQDDEVVYLGEGKAQNPFAVYGRETECCPRCGDAIVRDVIGGRSSYSCPTCQPPIT